MRFQRAMGRRKLPAISDHARYIVTVPDVSTEVRAEFVALPNRAAKRDWIRARIAGR